MSLQNILLCLLFGNVKQLQAQIFDTSVSNEYENSMITCSESNCQIICDTTYGCSQATVDASVSQTLTISCLQNNSCAQMNIVSAAQTSTHIECKHLQSCSGATFNTANSQNVNLTCAYNAATTEPEGTCYEAQLNANTSTNVNVNCTGDYSCNNVNINTENVANILDLNCNGRNACYYGEVHCPLQNECNIVCSSDSFSCSFMELYIENVDSNFHIDCPGSSAIYSSAYDCTHTDIYCGGSSKTSFSTLLYDSKSAWSCHMNDGCCPSYFYASTTTCNTQQCVIDCVTNDCSTHIIDGTTASSLTVNCSSPSSGGGCGVTSILCPATPNSVCTVNCQGDKSCYQSFIKATDSYSLQLDCNGVESCRTVDVNCPSDDDYANGGCVVNCNGEKSCYYGGSIAATNAYSMDLVCQGRMACFAFKPIYLPYHRVGACNINCSSDDESMCFGMMFYVNDEFIHNYLDLKCATTDSNNVCGNQLFACDADGSTTKGSTHMTFDSANSRYTCAIEPDNYLYTCCPWDPTQETDKPTQSPSQNPSEPSINPTTGAPTQTTTNPTTHAPTIATLGPTMQPTTVDVVGVVDSAPYPKLFIVNTVLFFVLICNY